jgi:hypothetical protein
VPRQPNGERIVFSTNGAGTNETYICIKRYLNLYPSKHVYKQNLKMKHIYLNVKCELYYFQRKT